MSIKTPLGKVKYLGAAGNGTTEYIHQRVSAIFMVALLTWFILSAIYLRTSSGEDVALYFLSPFNLTFALLFIGTSLYHANLGIKVVIEDYIHCNALKIGALIVIYFVNIATFVAATATVFGIHITFKLYG